MHRSLAFASVLFVALAACSDGDEPTPQSAGAGAGADGEEIVTVEFEDPSNPLELEPWLPDFPAELRYSPRQPGKWYDRSRRGALEQIAANLSGLCTREAWVLAKDFFRRVPAEDRDILVTTFDRGIQAASTDLVETTLAAMAVVGDPSFGPSIERAFGMKSRGVENAAARALYGCANRELLLKLRDSFGRWGLFAQVKWFEAAARVLEPQELAGDIRKVFELPYYAGLRRDLLELAVKLPPEDALHAIEPIVGVEEHVDVIYDALRHATGDTAGTARLADRLRSDSPKTVVNALKALAHGGAAEFRDQILPLASHHNPGVRFEVISILRTFPFDDAVRGTLESLALDEVTRVRQAALFELRERGEFAMLDDLIVEIRTATGTNLRDRMGDLVAARDVRAIPVMVQRMEQVPPVEKWKFAKSIAFVRARESFPPLRDLFVDEAFCEAVGDAVFSRIAVLILNAEGAELDVLELFRAIDREDYARRVVLLDTLAGLAVDRDDPELAAKIYEAMFEIVTDTTEVPQMRLVALEKVRRGMTLDHVMTLKRQTRREESPGMQRALTDALLEFF